MNSIGIVGLGKMGILHAGILNALPESKVVAVSEKEGLLRRVAKKILPEVSFYDSASKMVQENELQAVYVTTPIVSHASIVEELARVGSKVSLFIEKPLAGSIGEANSIISNSSSLGNVNMIGFQKRFLPQFQRVKSLLEAKALGELLFFRGFSFVSGVFSSNGAGWRFEKGQGGSLLDLGPHLLDLVLWYFGEPASLSASERNFYSKQVEDYSHVAFEFKSGLFGHVDVSWSIPGYRLPETQLEIHGTNGTAIVNDDALNIKINQDIPGVIASEAKNLRKPELISGVDFLLGDPEYCLEDQYFLNCVQNRKVPDPGLVAGLKVNKIVEVVHASSAKKVMVVIA